MLSWRGSWEFEHHHLQGCSEAPRGENHGTVLPSLSTDLKSIGEIEKKTSQCRGSLNDESSSPYFSTANHKRSISTPGKAETLTQMHLCLERK